MDIRGPLINSMRQTPTRLSYNFFSPQNMNYIQSEAQGAIKNETGLLIDRQNYDDLGAIMRMIYVTNVFDPYGDVTGQIRLLNSRTLNMIVGQIRTGLSERIGYLRDISRPIQPNPLPVPTTLYGNKMPLNNKIGL
jgi:hypothetical protein